MDWSLAGASEAGGNPAVTLVLTDSDYTRAMWPHAFKAGRERVFCGWGAAGRSSAFPLAVLQRRGPRAAVATLRWRSAASPGGCAAGLRQGLQPAPSSVTNPCLSDNPQAEYTVSLEGEALHTRLKVTNTGDQPLSFTSSLHSYFAVRRLHAACAALCSPVQPMLSVQLCAALCSSVHCPGATSPRCHFARGVRCVRRRRWQRPSWGASLAPPARLPAPEHDGAGPPPAAPAVQVADVETAKVRGLQGLEYLDRVGSAPALPCPALHGAMGLCPE